jgi:nitrate reductase delta subunit
MTGDRTEHARLLQAAALCLEYPDEDWLTNLPLLSEAVRLGPGPGWSQLGEFVAHVERTAPDVLVRDYVDTFDLRRRCCLYLTYYTFGDTRKRGMALLRFTHAYRSAGYELESGELPDHLAVVCEFSARCPDAGLQLIADNRAGIELLHLALGDAGSPYAEVVAAVRGLLPPATPQDLDRALVLARTGPPAEEVGLEPFAPPEVPGARR